MAKPLFKFKFFGRAFSAEFSSNPLLARLHSFPIVTFADTRKEAEAKVFRMLGNSETGWTFQIEKIEEVTTHD